MLRGCMRTGKAVAIITTAALGFGVSSCGWMPHVKVPFIGGGGEPAQADPHLPFKVSEKLSPGHKLTLAVYRGLRSPSRIYDGSVIIDPQGMVHFKDAGDVKIGGLSALRAAHEIEAAFHHRYADSIINVHLLKIGELPLVTVTGAVRTPGVIQWFEGITAVSSLPYVGGRDGRHNAFGGYVTRKGVRYFHSELPGVTLEPGDILNFSSEL
jgi:hypothetical protein